MSSDRTNEIPSNDEVIDELTKNMKASAIKTDSFDDDTTRRISESDKESDTPANEETEIRDVDYIEDNLLKERDEKLSEEEKRVSDELSLTINL